MKEIGLMEKKKEKESQLIIMVIHMKVNGKIIIKLAKVCMLLLQVINSKETLKTVNSMEKVLWHLLMVINKKETGKMENLYLELILLRKVINILVNGKTG